ncbi:caspase family protein [Microbulbifer sp. CnH-101-E]|uniref:caspase family protein n=1 Tax=unclassified Microbulbifer TaxID=2619833 RepID=UPI004039119F
MNRTAILIGVRQTDILPELPAVWDCVERMTKWMQSQGVNDENIRVITDKEKPVTFMEIWEAVKEFVDLHTIDQLIIYFSGHGINIHRNEFWLLSNAIVNTSEAINLEGSVDLARDSSIPHVIFISDACRTAADSSIAHGVKGGELFPNYGPQVKEQKIDLFFATRVGMPSMEIVSKKKYKGVYTETLVEALQGDHAHIVEMDTNIGRNLIRPHPLNDFLEVEVPKRTFKLVGKSQVPNARITSTNSWLSELPLKATELNWAAPPENSSPSSDHDLTSLSQQALVNVINQQPADIKSMISQVSTHVLTEARAFDDLVATCARTFGPENLESKCGFKISGKRPVEALAMNASVEILGNDLNTVNVQLETTGPENILLIFDDGTGVVLPAIQEFIGALTFADEGLISVNYDSMATSSRWGEFKPGQRELQQLRSIVTAATAMGSFSQSNEAVLEKINRIILSNVIVDPSLSIYMSYAYRDLGNREPIHMLARYLRNTLGFCLFDVAMLSRELDGHTMGDSGQVFPFAPLLSQGWALLSACKIVSPNSLNSIREYIVPNSFWTLYNPDGVNAIHLAMQHKEV